MCLLQRQVHQTDMGTRQGPWLQLDDHWTGARNWMSTSWKLPKCRWGFHCHHLPICFLWLTISIHKLLGCVFVHGKSNCFLLLLPMWTFMQEHLELLSPLFWIWEVRIKVPSWLIMDLSRLPDVRIWPFHAAIPTLSSCPSRLLICVYKLKHYKFENISIPEKKLRVKFTTYELESLSIPELKFWAQMPYCNPSAILTPSYTCRVILLIIYLHQFLTVSCLSIP